MKKNVVMLLSILMPMMATTGCQSQQEKYNNMLSNAKIKNIESYSQLGYVSKSISTNKKNGRKNAWGSYGKKQTSKSYLAGLVGEEVTGLSLSNGSSFWDIPISIYCDLGDFIGFTPEGFYDYSDAVYEINNIKSCGYVAELAYILSKKTGKIYYINQSFDASATISFFLYGSKALYTKYNAGNDYSYWATVVEENEQLVITKSDMLQFLDPKLNSDDVKFDKYGNILVDGKIYGYNQKALEPNIKIDMPYVYEPFTNTFYTYYDDSFYILEGLEFKKYDNVIFGYSFGGLNGYFYYSDEQGKYKVGYEKGHSYENTRLYSSSGIDLLSVPTIKVFQNYYLIYIGDNAGQKYGPMEVGGEGLYEKLDTYTYLPLERSNNYLYGSSSIWRDK